MGLFKDDAPPPPDYTPIANASAASAQMAAVLAQQQFDWARQRYAEDKAVTDRVVGSFLDTQRRNADAAARDRARYEDTFQPLEDELVRDAQSFATPERKALEMGKAEANVAQQFDAARQSAQRNLESFGVNPNATRFAALDIGLRTQQAAAMAAEGNRAAATTDATGRALRSEALNIGKGYPGQVAGTYGTALQAGTGGANGQLAQTASGANTMGTGTQWSTQGNQALTTWGNTLNTGYNNAMQGWQADQADWQGLGALAGAGLGMLSGSKKPWIFAADGGPIPDEKLPPSALPATPGGAVPPQASPSSGIAVDDVNAKLTAGEYVIPRDVVEVKGTEFFERLIQSARKAKHEATAKPTRGMALPGPAAFQSRPAGALPVGAM